MLHLSKSCFAVALTASIGILTACSSMNNPHQSGMNHSNLPNKTTQAVRANLPTTESAAVNATYPALPPAAGMVRLVEGQSVYLKDKNLSLKFVNVSQDSRCPLNAQCISAGSATVQIEVTASNARTQSVSLTTGVLRGEDKRNANMFGYNLSLETLYPTPATDLDNNKLAGKYVIDVKLGAEKPIIAAPKS